MSATDRREVTPAVMVAAELGLLAVGLATVLGFSRLFLGTRYLGPLALAVTVSWAMASATRRVGWGVGRSGLVSAVGAVLVLTWTFASHTTWFGLPNATTVDSLLTDVHRAFRGFSRMVAPVPATTGFLVLLAAIMWAFTFFADTAAFRFRGPVQAVIPYTSAFVATGVLARDSGRIGAAVAFLSGVAVYAVTQRALRASERRWIPGQARRGTAAVAAGAGVAVAVAVVVGAIAGPLLPGDTEAVLDLRAVGRSGGARTVVSPFVGVGSLLGAQSDTVMFEVTSTEPAYWRLTALARYDTERDIWTSRGSYREVDGSELVTERGSATTRTRQAYRIEGLGGPWVPAAFEPVEIDIDAEVSFDARTASVITRGESLPVGTRYRVESASERLDPKDLTAARRPDTSSAEYLDTSGVSPLVARTAQEIVAGAVTPYNRMILLQNWFRDHFEYDTDVDYRDDADPVAAFLDRRVGFCQQFASSFALMARSLGVPSRVGVGFTQGDAVGTVDDVTPGDGSDGSGAPATRYVVRGRHAHTWPEVYFDGVGWVAFEPTTGRGNPQAQTYTGVEPQQAEAPSAQASTTAPATTTTVSGPVDTTPTGDRLDTVAPDADETPSPGRSRWAWLVLGATTTLAVVAVGLRIRHRRRRFAVLAADPRGGRVAVAWARAVEDLAAMGVAPRVAETPSELARRVRSADALHVLDERTTEHPTPGGPDRTEVVAAMGTLARIETSRRYGPNPPDDHEANTAEEAAAVLRRAARSVLGRRDRVRRLVGSSSGPPPG